MQKQLLNGDWQFRQSGTDEWLPATVPGGVHTDLLALGKIPDPFVADNELKVLWVAETDWEYRRTFTIAADLLAQPQVTLVCDGLDTLADVSVNGTYLGHANNMFRRWEWDVKPLLRAGENEICIFFGSPLRFIAGKQAQLPLTGGGDIPGAPHLRKAPCHFGWDWGPKLPPIGVWKEIRLEGFATRLTDVHLRQSVDEALAVVSADVYAQAGGSGMVTASMSSRPHSENPGPPGPGSIAPMMASMTVTGPGGEVVQAEEQLLSLFDEETLQEANLSVEIPNPQLWWPAGYGAQPLYNVEITLTDGQTVLDQRSYQIGLRTIELRQELDQWGQEFTFYVNGVRLFAKGADWIPTDSLPTRITETMLEGLLKSAVDANMNMLRVWGGGYYPEDMFYALCDRYGLLIWQDFMFACGIYPADADFFENVRVEAVENVRRLRHHASLALWCGNNEMEQGWCDWGWNKPEDPLNQRLKDGYDRMFHQMLPELLEFEDPDHPYWPSSASANTPFEGANNQIQGDCHYWDVWHGRKPFTAYRTQFPRFMSEFGFQALPPLKTIATYADPADWNMTSYIMEHHQRSGSGNGLMIAQMTDTFRMPKDFDALVYLSLLLQAEGIRYGVEHWRRNRNRVSGTLIWQLNDCWPVASWASLDYFGRWKALHYAAKRFYAPLLLSVAEDGKTVKIHVTSDLTTPVDVLVRWRLETLAGQILQSGEGPVRAMALADTFVSLQDFSTLITAENRREVVFVCEMWRAGERVACSVTPFVANKHLELKDPALEVKTRVEDQTLFVDVSARSLARFVELSIEGADPVFSDNYFDLPAGAIVTVSCPLSENRTVSARSLYNSFA
jgi:beta-mannosidase